ncbi:MAG: hypothetical protein V1837_00415 [Candidatus Woesearchaeota archaeon]
MTADLRALRSLYKELNSRYIALNKSRIGQESIKDSLYLERNLEHVLPNKISDLGYIPQDGGIEPQVEQMFDLLAKVEDVVSKYEQQQKPFSLTQPTKPSLFS